MNKKILPVMAVCAVFISSQDAVKDTTVFADDMAVFSEQTSAQYTVSADKKGTPISPYIYGINDVSDIKGDRYTALKQCDIAVSAYNWENNFSNSGAKGRNTNDVALVKSYSSNLWDTPALYTDKLWTHAKRNGIDSCFVTLQMMGRVAADSMGVVSEDDFSSRWKGISFVKNDVYTTKPDSGDDVIYIDEYLSYLVNKYSYASDGGIRGYFLDREPDLWSTNFPYTGLSPITPEEFCRRSSELAQTVKTIDGTALVFGPSMSSISGCIDLGNDKAWDKIAANSEYSWFIDYYLSYMKEAARTAGTRVLDVLDVHYYTAATTPLGTAVINGNDAYTDAYRMQSVRTLWDQSYTENSVTALTAKQYTPFIPALQASIRLNYPDTKLSFSEYNFGGGMNMSGAIAEIDALGTFAREGVYLACLAPTGDTRYQRAGMRLFTNYDGSGSSFGSTLVPSKGGDVLGSLYCARDDENRLTMVFTNQNIVAAKDVSISIDSKNTYEVTAVYDIDRNTAEIVSRDIDLFPMEGSTLSFSAEPESAYMIVLSEIYEEPTNVTESESSSETDTSSTDVSETEPSVTTPSESPETAPPVTEQSETASESITEVSETSLPATEETSESEALAPVIMPDITETPEETEITVTEEEPPEEPAVHGVSMILKITATLLAGAASFATVYVLLSK